MKLIEELIWSASEDGWVMVCSRKEVKVVEKMVLFPLWTRMDTIISNIEADTFRGK